MKQKIIFTALLLAIAINLVKAQTVSELFVKSPEREFLTLTTSDRLDLIDMYKAGQKAVVKNLLDDTCSLISLKNDYMQLVIGENTTEMFLLTMINDSKIVGLIQTVCAPVCDSKLEFYTTTWKKIDTSAFITLAGKNDFIKEGINTENQSIKNALIPLDISLMQLHYEPDKQELHQFYRTPEYLSETEMTKAMPYLTGTPKLFKWNQIRFE
jgi:hypothetical protein